MIQTFRLNVYTDYFMYIPRYNNLISTRVCRSDDRKLHHVREARCRPKTPGRERRRDRPHHKSGKKSYYFYSSSSDDDDDDVQYNNNVLRAHIT